MENLCASYAFSQRRKNKFLCVAQKYHFQNIHKPTAIITIVIKIHAHESWSMQQVPHHQPEIIRYFAPNFFPSSFSSLRANEYYANKFLCEHRQLQYRLTSSRAMSHGPWFLCASHLYKLCMQSVKMKFDLALCVRRCLFTWISENGNMKVNDPWNASETILATGGKSHKLRMCTFE